MLTRLSYISLFPSVFLNRSCALVKPYNNNLMRTYRVFNVLTACRKTQPVKHNRTYSFSTNSFENPNELSGEQKFSCDYRHIVVKYFTFACKLNRI